MKLISSLAVALLTIVCFLSQKAFAGYYSEQLCSQPGYTCIKVKRGDTWEKLFPNSKDQELVRRINRININLQPGVVLAVPDRLDQLDIMNFSPFPDYIELSGNTTLIVDLSDLAFAAYDVWGSLIYWGPISGGKDWCPDVGRGCRTKTGIFQLQSKGGPYCVSSKYPVPEGGAPMPYCMYFYNGYALHASTLPGRHDSHGCIRLFYDDAKWLNKEFVELGKGRRTKVIVRP